MKVVLDQNHVVDRQQVQYQELLLFHMLIHKHSIFYNNNSNNNKLNLNQHRR
jgi:hypothetical protein